MGRSPAPGEPLPDVLQALRWAIVKADSTCPPREPVRWRLFSSSFLDEETQSQGS